MNANVRVSRDLYGVAAEYGSELNSDDDDYQDILNEAII